MTPGEFIAAFDVIAEAPGGIERLRELVLQLAVRGRLVPQDEGDEPAAVLLDRIREERAQLIHAKQIRPQKQREPITCSQLKVPEGWKHLYLGDVIDLEYGKSLPHKDRKESGDVPVYGSNGVVGQHDVALVNGPCIVVGRKGSAGAVTLAGTSCWPIDTTYFVRPYGNMSLKYTSLMLSTARLEDLDRATAIPGLNREEAYLRETFLPPLAEQHRIVAKVDKLMGLIDRLAATRRSREDCRTAGRDSALAALRNAATPEEVGTAWTRIVERMDELFTAPADLVPLREAVLQLAVRGRLVPQDSGDQSAAVLLEHIAEERARLVRIKKIGKQKPVPDLAHSATAVELPSGWTWTCTAALGVVNPRNVAEDDAMVSFCPMPVIPTDYRQPIAPETRRWGDIKKGYTHFAEGDVVVAKITPCFQNRKSCVMTGLEGGIGAGTTELHVIRIIAKKVVPEYLLIFYKSPDFLQMGVATMTGTAGQQRVPREYFTYTPLPLPPLAEQHRIVAKVNELMGLIDRLERHLVTKEETQGDFAVAAVYNL